jgi:hypothetical protein
LFQQVIRWWRPRFAFCADAEVQSGFEVLHPRFLCVQGLFKCLMDCYLRSTLPTCCDSRQGQLDLIGSHFAIQMAKAALLRRWLVPVTITLRGTEVRYRTRIRRRLMIAGSGVLRIFSVRMRSRHVVAMGISADKVSLLAMADTQNFIRSRPLRARTRYRTGRTGVDFSGVVERKGMHRDRVPPQLSSVTTAAISCRGGQYRGRLACETGTMVADLGIEHHAISRPVAGKLSAVVSR